MRDWPNVELDVRLGVVEINGVVGDTQIQVIRWPAMCHERPRPSPFISVVRIPTRFDARIQSARGHDLTIRARDGAAWEFVVDTMKLTSIGSPG